MLRVLRRGQSSGGSKSGHGRRHARLQPGDAVPASMRTTPERPARRLSRTAFQPLPIGAMPDIPVITTRRLIDESRPSAQRS